MSSEQVHTGRRGNFLVTAHVRAVADPDGVIRSTSTRRDIGARRFWFKCPGCDDIHTYLTGPQHEGESEPRWTFNGNFEQPTFSPSLLVRYGNEPGAKRCHLFMVDGRLKFLGDCTHHLAGQIVPIPELPEWLT